jgi:hypothetical protein
MHSKRSAVVLKICTSGARARRLEYVERFRAAPEYQLAQEEVHPECRIMRSFGMLPGRFNTTTTATTAYPPRVSADSFNVKTVGPKTAIAV